MNNAAVTQMPRRNPLIRLLYGTGLVGMFGFIGWIAQPDSQYLVWVGLIAPAHAAETDNAEQQTGFAIAGVSATLQLQQPVDRQLAPLWQQLAERDYARALNSPEPGTLYLVYSAPRDNYREVTVTAGYRIGPKGDQQGLVRASVPTGHYLSRPGSTVLASWADSQLQPKLTFSTDFERYQLGTDYSIQQQTAFVGVEAP